MPTYADAALAARLESLCAAEMRRFVETACRLDSTCGAAALEIGGGVAAFIGPGSPVNQAFGLGFEGVVDIEVVVALEEFYAARAARPLMGVAPMAHASLFEALGARGWLVDGFENVLYREYDGVDVGATPADIEVREVVDAEGRDLWGLVAATGFSAPLPPLAEQLVLGSIVVNRPGRRLFLALVEGKAAGTGELFVEDGVAWLSADATLPQFRRRGVQQALQAHRLRLGAVAGCEIAASEAAPGSGSQRNMERAGFRVAYTRVDFVRPADEAAPMR